METSLHFGWDRFTLNILCVLGMRGHRYIVFIDIASNVSKTANLPLLIVLIVLNICVGM